jgi:SHS family lactate transporter-like MFS transporter
MGLFEKLYEMNSNQKRVAIASFLSWTLDAFDFFILVFVLPEIARDFSVGITTVSFAIFLTLAMRPVGAFIFGRLADKFGRRIILIIDVILYSFFEFASAFVPNLALLFILRVFFGIAMGGVWGVASSLAMESIPVKARGFISGLFQGGYPCGYFLGALVYGLLFDLIGWRGLFIVGAIPPLFVIYMLRNIPESPIWTEGREKIKNTTIVSALRKHWRCFTYMIILMTAFNMFSHGSQDLYPTFLKIERHFNTHTISILTMIMNVGAIVGSLTFGLLSERIGRRFAIIMASLLALAAIPLWMYSTSIILLAFGAFVIQVMIQGAWGVVPAYLNELSPGEIRGTMPGFAYQIGNLLAAITPTLQALIASLRGNDYAFSLSVWIAAVAITLAFVTFLGKEMRGVLFHLQK